MGIKYGVSSYSFSQKLQDGSLDQVTFLDKAKEMGFDAAEFVDMPQFGVIDETFADRLKQRAKALNLPIICFTFGADFLNGSGGNVRAEIERVKRKVDIAAMLGAKLVRHDATVGNAAYRTFDDALPILADACREVTKYADALGIRTMIENHGYFCQGSLRVEKLVHAVGHENFGLLTDMGNFICADEDPAVAMSLVARYAFYAHAKDFHLKRADQPNPGRGFGRTRGGNYFRGAIIGHGDVPVLAALAALKQAGYNGVVSIEFEGMEACEQAISIGLENLKRYSALLG